MKKILSLMLVAVLLLCMNTVAFAAGTTVANTGDTVTVSVNSDGAEELLHSIGYYLNYDGSELEFVSGSGFLNVNQVPTDRVLIEKIDTSGNPTGFTLPAGAMATVTFKVLKDNVDVDFDLDFSISITMSGKVDAVKPSTSLDINVNALTYHVDVEGGSGSGDYTKGATVTVTADQAPNGMVFKEWQVVSGNVTLADAGSYETSFTMPANAVSLKAVYDDAPHEHEFGTAWENGGDGYHYHVCACGVKDEATKQAHAPVLREAQAASCCYDGTIAHYECPDCLAKFSDAEGTTEIDSIVDPATGDHIGTGWKSDADGHWHECDVGGTSFGYEAHKGGTADCVDGKYCSVCSREYTGTDPYNHVSYEKTYASNYDGTHNVLYKCCGSVYSSREACEYGDNEVCKLCGYNNKHTCKDATLHAGHDATCSEAGEMDYYVCSCGRKYYDAACTQPVVDDADLVIPATEKHTDADGDNKCDACNFAEVEAPEDNPPTGDKLGFTAIIFALALGCAMVFCSDKKLRCK